MIRRLRNRLSPWAFVLRDLTIPKILHGLYVDGRDARWRGFLTCRLNGPTTLDPPVRLQPGQAARLYCCGQLMAVFVERSGFAIDPIETLTC